jgi:hypothetical protein
VEATITEEAIAIIANTVTTILSIYFFNIFIPPILFLAVGLAIA